MESSDGDAGRDALSLFAGAGGLDLGLEEAGWSIVAQIDNDEDAIETLRLQASRCHSSPKLIGKSVEDVDVRELRQELGLGKGDLALLAGGPPCQPFTTSGLRKSIGDARAAETFAGYLTFLDEFQPQALLIENVDGMLSAAIRHRPLKERGKDHPPLAENERKGSFLRSLLTELAARQYSVSWGVVEAADYGVAQMRQRAILIGVQADTPCFLPPGTHGGSNQPSYRTLKDALGDLEEVGPVQPLSERKKRVYEWIPPGGNWRDLSDEMQRETMGAAYHAEGGKSGWWRRLSWDAPAPTVLGMPDHSSTALVHPDETRCLSVYECAAVQSFPSWVRFAGSPRSMYQQVGNAVPPLLGEALGNHLRAFLDGTRQPTPEPPPWRQASANRRIGTHGWAIRTGDGGDPHITINAKVRRDHVWAVLEGVELRGGT